MTYRTRKIISNILLFLESVFLFSIILLLTTKLTFNKNTVIKKMDKTNYYENLYNETLDNMEYITKKSGYSTKILDEVFYIEDIKRDTNKYVECIFKNEKLEIDTDSLKEELEINLNKYLEEKNIEVEDTKKQEYINKITNTYKNEIRLMKEYNNISKDINNKCKLVNTLLLIFILDLIVLIIINEKIFNKREYHVICFSSALSLIVIDIFIKIYSNKLFLYNNSITKVFKSIIKQSSGLNILFIILLSILGILSYKYIKEEKEEIYE